MEEMMKRTLSLPKVVPAVAIRDVVMFPGMSLPLSVDREKSIFCRGWCAPAWKSWSSTP